ncbi:MAG: hypothetical protein ACYC9O_10200 [Candidatus Latescibacterota bacterium]
MRRYIGLVCVLLVLGAALPSAQEAPVSLAGTWQISLEFVCGKATHTAAIAQKDSTLSGAYKGSVKEGQLRGRVSGNTVTLGTSLRNDSASAPFNYTGTVKGDVMEGTVSMGEYWNAKFTAKRIGK